MDTLNFVVNLLNLLVNLFTGLAPFVWMVAKDVFQTTKHDAKIFTDKNNTTASSLPNRAVVLLSKMIAEKVG